MNGDITLLNEGGEKIIRIPAPIVTSDGVTKIGALGYLCKDLAVIAQRGETNLIASFIGNVARGVILTQHIFRGLDRPLLTDGNVNADGDILVYSRKPAVDWEWKGDRFAGKPVAVDPQLPGLVFVVIVSPNVRHIEKFSSIDGWVSAWNWVQEDSGLPEAPIGWVDRYREKIWTRTAAKGDAT